MAVWDERAKLLIRGGLSLIVLTCGLMVILTGVYSDSTEKWAFGAIGIVLGYWLR